MAEMYDGNTVKLKVTIDIRQDGQGGMAKIRNLVDRYLKAPSKSGVMKLAIQGRSDENDQLSVVDLIDQSEKYIRNLPINEKTRNIDYEQRWDAMLDIRREAI